MKNRKFYFIVKKLHKWPELLNENLSNIQDLDKRLVNNEDAWIVLTYIRLKEIGMNVFVTNKLVENEICVVNGDDIRIRDLSYRSFIVSCKADSYYPKLANYYIVHNKENIKGKNYAFLNLWAQPNLVPRDISRHSQIQNISYKGVLENLDRRFRTSEFLEELRKIGVQLHINNLKDTKGWADYSTDDLILAARNLTIYDAYGKPAMKLINSWIAGVPALLGPEPAYLDLKKSEYDFIQVKTTREVLDATKKLINDKDFYLSMIENGLKRAKEFTDKEQARRWKELLEDNIRSEYEEWLKTKDSFKKITFITNVIKNNFSKRLHKHKVFNGKRILDC